MIGSLGGIARTSQDYENKNNTHHRSSYGLPLCCIRLLDAIRGRQHCSSSSIRSRSIWQQVLLVAAFRRRRVSDAGGLRIHFTPKVCP